MSLVYLLAMGIYLATPLYFDAPLEKPLLFLQHTMGKQQISANFSLSDTRFNATMQAVYTFLMLPGTLLLLQFA